MLIKTKCCSDLFIEDEADILFALSHHFENLIKMDPRNNQIIIKYNHTKNFPSDFVYIAIILFRTINLMGKFCIAGQATLSLQDLISINEQLRRTRKM